MAGVTIKKTGEAPEPKRVQVTDKQGRVLTLEEPNFLSEFRLMEAVGPELSSNVAWMMVYTPLTYITQIDGDPVFPAQNKMQAEALINRVGRDGYRLVHEAIQEHFRVTEEDLDFAKTQQAPRFQTAARAGGKWGAL